jgi:hypothetical protein
VAEFVRQQSRLRAMTGPRSWLLGVGSSSHMHRPERVVCVHRDRLGGRAGMIAFVSENRGRRVGSNLGSVIAKLSCGVISL